MRGLLYKDWLLVRKSAMCFVAILLFSFGMVAVAVRTSDIRYSFGEDISKFMTLITLFPAPMAFFLGDMIASSLLPMDERKKWAYFIISSPQRASGQIIEKYVMIFLLNLAILALYCCGMLLLFGLAGVLSDVKPMLLSGAAFFLLAVFYKAFELPFLSAFGAKAGNGVRVCILMVLFLGIAVYYLFGDTSFIGSSDKTIETVLRLVRGFQKRSIRAWFALASGGVLALYALSYQLSRRLYIHGIQFYSK